MIIDIFEVAKWKIKKSLLKIKMKAGLILILYSRWQLMCVQIIWQNTNSGKMWGKFSQKPSGSSYNVRRTSDRLHFLSLLYQIDYTFLQTALSPFLFHASGNLAAKLLSFQADMCFPSASTMKFILSKNSQKPCWW